MADAHERFRQIRDAHRDAYGSEADWRCVCWLMTLEKMAERAVPPPRSWREAISSLSGRFVMLDRFGGDMAVPRRAAP